MKRASPHFWLGTGRSGVRHIGFDFARALHLACRRSFTSSFKALLSLFILQLFSSLIWALGYYSQIPLESSRLLLLFSAAISVFGLMPFFLIKSCTKSATKRIHLDFFIALLLVGFGIRAIATHQLLAADSLFAIQSLGFLFILIRTAEALPFLRYRKDRKTWALAAAFFEDLKREESRLYLFGFGLGLIFFTLAVGLFWWNTHFTPSVEAIAIAAIPLFFPFSTWIYSRLAQQFSGFGIQLTSFKLLFQIQKINFLRLHHFGVLTSPHYSTPDFFFDPSSAWEESFIKNLIRDLVQSSIHPMSRAVQEALGANPQRTWDVENIPYAGLRSSFRTPDGKKHELVLSSYHWMCVHQHQFSSEINRLIEEWKAANYVMSFVSIDSRVVAGVAVASARKPHSEAALQNLKRLGFKLALWSSSSKESLGDWKDLFHDQASELLPVQREIQAYHWKERNADQISIQSSWDPAEEGIRIVFHDDPHQNLSESEIHVVSGRIEALPVFFEESQVFSRTHRLGFLLPAFLSTLFAGFAFFLPISLLVVLVVLTQLFLAWKFSPNLTREMAST